MTIQASAVRNTMQPPSQAGGELRLVSLLALGVKKLQALGLIYLAMIGTGTPTRADAAPGPTPPTCTVVESRLSEAAKSFRELLPGPKFVPDEAWPGTRTARNIRSIAVYLRCTGGQFQGYETFAENGDTPTLLRWTFWSIASLISTDPQLGRDKAFRLIQRLQKAAIAESEREEIRSGDKAGCARLKSGNFEYEYSVQPGQVRAAFRPAADENASCMLLK
jgi:hypothetical protein